MNNVMTFEGGYRAVIAYDPEIEMFRGEFVGLNGAADFYAADLEGLRREGKTSLEVFLEVCAEKGIAPKNHAPPKPQDRKRTPEGLFTFHVFLCMEKKFNNASVSSPRVWGCFAAPCLECCTARVFPTRVGVFLPLAT